MSRNSCDLCGGIQDAHTADCPNRVDDRAVVVGEALAAHFLVGIACSCMAWNAVLTKPVIRPGVSDQHYAHVAAVILAALDLTAQGLTCGHPNHGEADHDCQPFRTPGAPA